MAQTTGKYEVVMVFSTAKGDDQVTELNSKFKTMIEENGTIDSVDEWGKRRLAYPINDENEGYYCLVKFTSKPDFPAELDRVFKITEGILRTMIVSRDEK